MSSSFDAYKIFYYVGKFNNITHAANALFLSQSTVSRSIQSLESDLGCKLFERFQHGVVLTAEGEMLYNHVAHACEEILLAEDEIKLLNSSMGKVIRLGVDNFILTQFILPVMKDFHKDFPDVSIEFTADIASKPEDAIRSLFDEKVDAVFTLGPIPETHGIVSSVLGDYTDVFIAGKNFTELNGDRVRLYDVSIPPYVSLASGICGAAYLRDTFAGHGIRVEPCYKVEDLHQLLNIVNNGICLALVPSPLYRSNTHHGNIFNVKVNTTLPKRNICLLTSKNNLHNPLRDELIKRIKKNIQASLS